MKTVTRHLIEMDEAGSFSGIGRSKENFDINDCVMGSPIDFLNSVLTSCSGPTCEPQGKQRLIKNYGNKVR